MNRHLQAVMVVVRFFLVYCLLSSVNKPFAFILVAPTDILAAGAIAGIIIGAVIFVVLASSVAVFRKKIFPYRERQSIKMTRIDTSQPSDPAPERGTWQSSVASTSLKNV